MALIRFYFKYKPETIDDFAEAWQQVVYLQEIQVLPMAQVPLKFK